MPSRPKFRVRPADPKRVQFCIELPGVAAGSPDVLDVGTDSCTLRWPRSSAPKLAVGCAVQGTVRFEGVDTSFLVRLRPVSRMDSADDLTYGFEVEVDGPDRDEYLAAIVSTFDRRAKMRVQADPANSIRAVISPESGCGEVCGRVRDLSEGGISVIADTVADEVLFAADVLCVSVRLPTDSQPLKLRAKVHARQSVQSGLLYRMEFLPGSSENFSAQRRLAQYVKARRREPLVTV